MTTGTADVVVDVLVTEPERRSALVSDVRRGLGGSRKILPPVWFYDETGSRLFDDITRLPEYYLTRVEAQLLSQQAAQIASLSGADTLVELGSGTSEKTRLLLDAMAAAGRLRRVVLLDISEEVLREAADVIRRDYAVAVHAVVGDFGRHVSRVPRAGTQLWAFLGSTIGNLTPTARLELLAGVRGAMADGSRLLLGVDLVKDPARLVAAYDDARGVTAAFNRNLLEVLNRELGADFDASAFEHRAVWVAEEERMEMRLAARFPHTVRIADLDMTVAFASGEELTTEYSAKFRPDGLRGELSAAGLEVVQEWRDRAGDYQLTLAGPGAAAQAPEVTR